MDEIAKYGLLAGQTLQMAERGIQKMSSRPSSAEEPLPKTLARMARRALDEQAEEVVLELAEKACLQGDQERAQLWLQAFAELRLEKKPRT